MSYFLADVQTISANIAASQAVSAAWDAKWAQFFSGGIYQAINQVMLGIALLFLVITVCITMLDYAKTQSMNALFRLITPFIVTLFLINGGANAKTTILGIRAISNGLNTQFLTALQFNQNVNNRLNDLIGDQSAMEEIQKKVTECKAQSSIEAQKTCLQNLDGLIQTARSSGKIRDQNVLDKLATFGGNLSSVLSGTASVDRLKAVADPISGAIGNVVFAPAQALMFFVLQAITAAVQVLTEASFMMTALIAPIAIAGGLLPSGMKSIIALLTAFWTIVNYKLCYIIIVGLCAQINTDNTASEGLVLSLITAIFAPILAGILARGAGMGFAGAAVAATGQVAGTVAQVATSAATGGASSVASGIGQMIGKAVKK
jgi:hypothetical protein